MTTNRETLIALAIASVGNPLFLALVFQATSGGMLPDSALYLTFAKMLAAENILHIEGWAHIDNSIIPSPFYPLLIALSNYFGGDAILNSQFINSIFLIAACYPLYTFTRRHSTNQAAIVCLIIFQWNAKTFFYGTSTLTEGVFISLCVFFINALDQYIAKSDNQRAAIVGVLCILLVLTRQIGIFAPVLFTLVLGYLYQRKTIPMRVLADHALIFFSTITIPALIYVIPLYLQTGHTPLTQVYRLNRYVITTHEKQPELPGDYLSIYIKRREDRRLNDDATEMLSSMVYDTSTPSNPAGSSIVRYASNISSNIELATSALGSSLLLLFGICSAGSIITFSRKNIGFGKILIPLAAIIYLAVLSLVSSKIARYLDIFYPLIPCQIAIAIYASLNISPQTKKYEKIIWPTVFILFMSLTPKLALSEKFSRTVGEQGNPLLSCRQYITSGEPIFSLSTLEPYLLGGYYRALPNDSLERILVYAKHTSVRWMVIRKQDAGLAEWKLYNNAAWLNSSLPLEAQNSKVSAVCSDDEKVATLYRLN